MADEFIIDGTDSYKLIAPPSLKDPVCNKTTHRTRRVAEIDLHFFRVGGNYGNPVFWITGVFSAHVSRFDLPI